MTSDPRPALDRLVAALEAHLQAASRRTGEADPAVVAAYQTLADAFETYDEALYAAYDEVTPFVLYEDADDDEDDDEDDDDDDDDDDDEDDVDDGLEEIDEDLELDLGAHDGAAGVPRGQNRSG
ncbi:MAG TPA: primosomal protein [Kineosporiaceae bacterium]|nr:primosomal protein [Kineosporiaceae bacterium]